MGPFNYNGENYTNMLKVSEGYYCLLRICIITPGGIY
jgi:hypothetical protein